MMSSTLRKHATAVLQTALVTAVAASLWGPRADAQAAMPSSTQTASPGNGKAPSVVSLPVSDKAKHEAEKQYLLGARAVEHNDLEAAHTAFSQAAQLDPQNPDYAAADQLARANLVTQLIEESDKAQTLNHPDEARTKLLEAAGLAPDNPSVLQHLDPHNDISGQTADEDTKGLALAPAVNLTPDASHHSFHIHGTGQELLKQVLGAYGISPTIDPSVEVKRTNFDGDDLSYGDAANLLQLTTGSFFVPLDPKRVLVAKDTKELRTRFMREVLETVYLPGLTSAELTDMSNIARTLFDVQQSSVQPENNTLTVRAPQVRLTALNRTLADLLDGRSQVDLEVRLIEIDTSRMTNVGVQLPQQFTAFNAESEIQNIINSNQSLVQEVVSNGLAPAGDLAAIVAVLLASGEVTSPLLSGGYATFGNGLTLTGVSVPGVTANLALNSRKTRMLEDVHLRLQDQELGDVKIGEKYPIETSSYSGLATSSINIPGVSTAGLSSELAALGLGGAAGIQNPVPQVQYQDIGLELKVTPRIMRSNDVSMAFDLTVNEIPELTNREFQAIASAKAGQSAVFVSDLTKQESLAVSGVPGLSQLPGFQSTTDDTKTLQTTSLIIIITPRIVRHEHAELAGPAVVLTPHE
jgi:general secretion pathway protein D